MKLLISKLEIQQTVESLSQTLNSRFQKEEAIILVMLKGAFFFAADLLRSLTFSHSIQFLKATSYEKTESLGKLQFEYEPKGDFEGKTILIVDDILDTGLTLNEIKKWCLKKKPKAVYSCFLLDKPSRRKIAVEGDFIGRKIEDHFVVGYGLDYEERYRSLPEIFIL